MHRIISPKIKCLAIQAIQAFAIHAARHDPMVIVLFVIKIKIFTFDRGLNDDNRFNPYTIILIGLPKSICFIPSNV